MICVTTRSKIMTPTIETTTEIFQNSPSPHELVVLPNGNYAGMLDDEKRNYENRIVSFFLVNLPAVGGENSLHQ